MGEDKGTKQQNMHNEESVEDMDTNMDGEGLGDLVMCGFVRQTEGRHMEGGAW